MRNCLLSFLFVLFITFSLTAQVGIGTTNPNPAAALHITNIGVPEKGVLIAPMTSEERDAIVITSDISSNGLLIFNTTENCFNYWKKDRCVSLCGEEGYADVVVSEVLDWSGQVFGKYYVGQPMTTEHYLTLGINVVKEGKLNISVLTDNGYSFSYTSDLIKEGIHNLKLIATGTPIFSRNDSAAIFVNDKDVNIAFPIDVQPRLILRPYKIDCNSVVSNIILPQGIPAGGRDYVEFTVSSSSPEDFVYALYTHTINGVRFSLTGAIPSGDHQVVLRMYPTGEAIKAGVYTYTIHNNSSAQGPFCKFDLLVFHYSTP